MDNTGGTTPNPGEKVAPSATPETEAPKAETLDFNSFVKPEQEQPAGEQANTAPEAEPVAEAAPEAPTAEAAEQVPSKPAPEPEKDTDEPETPEMTELKQIEVPRDAESLPKKYVDAVAKVIKLDRQDPNKLASDVNTMKWDMMGKAYGRKLGDGLNGTGAAA